MLILRTNVASLGKAVKIARGYRQRVETTKREMFSQKSVRLFVSDSSGIRQHSSVIRHGRHVVSQCR